MIQPGWRFQEWGDPDLAELAGPAAGTVASSLPLAPGLASVAEALGRDTWRTFSALATLGAVDLTTARTLEPHIDALTILAQAGQPDLSPLGVTADTVWGVYAAQGPGHRLSARAGGDGTWRLSGSKPWCSLANRLSHALITAEVDDGDAAAGQGLFAVRLEENTSHADTAGWAPRGLVDVTTSTLHLNGAAGVLVGEQGWYVSRPGFGWGGIGVAAVWFGGAAAVAGRLWAAARRRDPDQLAEAALGRADRTLHAALLCLRDAAAAIDTGRAAGPSGQLLAARVRAVVAYAVGDVLRTVGHALGPGPLAHDAEHARRVADLTLYVRQHHAERDLAALGRLALEVP